MASVRGAKLLLTQFVPSKKQNKKKQNKRKCVAQHDLQDVSSLKPANAALLQSLPTATGVSEGGDRP